MHCSALLNLSELICNTWMVFWMGKQVIYDNCDLVVFVVGSSARFRSDQAIDPLLKWAKNSKPLAVYIAPDAPVIATTTSPMLGGWGTCFY